MRIQRHTFGTLGKKKKFSGAIGMGDRSEMNFTGSVLSEGNHALVTEVRWNLMGMLSRTICVALNENTFGSFQE